jgi:hypothetical protein
MTPAPSLQDLIEIVRRDAGGDDVLEQLATARAMVSELNDTGDALLGHYVDRARGSGRSWTEISNVLGVTKQAVHKRFAGNFFLGDEAPTFQRFTERARRAVEAAKPEAAALGHSYIGTEHLLLGLYAEPESIATRVLLAAPVTHEAVEAAVVARCGRGSGTGESQPSLTRRAAAVLTLALSEALKLGHNYIGTEHLLLAMYRDPDAIAPQVLTALGLDEETGRARVLQVLAAFERDRSGGTGQA